MGLSEPFCAVILIEEVKILPDLRIPEDARRLERKQGCLLSIQHAHPEKLTDFIESVEKPVEQPLIFAVGEFARVEGPVTPIYLVIEGAYAVVPFASSGR